MFSIGCTAVGVGVLSSSLSILSGSSVSSSSEASLFTMSSGVSILLFVSSGFLNILNRILLHPVKANILIKISI